jgi:hypothetical protein
VLEFSNNNIHGGEEMPIKAVFLDFYGTLVHEDDEIIPVICDQIRSSTETICEIKEIGSFWWKEFSGAFRNSYGDTFSNTTIFRDFFTISDNTKVQFKVCS